MAWWQWYRTIVKQTDTLYNLDNCRSICDDFHKKENIPGARLYLSIEGRGCIINLWPLLDLLSFRKEM